MDTKIVLAVLKTFNLKLYWLNQLKIVPVDIKISILNWLNSIKLYWVSSINFAHLPLEVGDLRLQQVHSPLTEHFLRSLEHQLLIERPGVGVVVEIGRAHV